MQKNDFPTDLLAILLADDPAISIRTPLNRGFLMEARVGIGLSPEMASLCPKLCTTEYAWAVSEQWRIMLEKPAKSSNFDAEIGAKMSESDYGHHYSIVTWRVHTHCSFDVSRLRLIAIRIGIISWRGGSIPTLASIKNPRLKGVPMVIAGSSASKIASKSVERSFFCICRNMSPTCS